MDTGNDEYLPLMMLNPPIALFEEEDRARFNGNDENGPSSQQQVVSNEYYPDFLRDN